MTIALKAEKQHFDQPPNPVAPGENWRVFPGLSQQPQPRAGQLKNRGTSGAGRPEMVLLTTSGSRKNLPGLLARVFYKGG